MYIYVSYIYIHIYVNMSIIYTYTEFLDKSAAGKAKKFDNICVYMHRKFVFLYMLISIYVWLGKKKHSFMRINVLSFVSLHRTVYFFVYVYVYIY
jgi:hypothetical protein